MVVFMGDDVDCIELVVGCIFVVGDEWYENVGIEQEMVFDYVVVQYLVGFGDFLYFGCVGLVEWVQIFYVLVDFGKCFVVVDCDCYVIEGVEVYEGIYGMYLCVYDFVELMVSVGVGEVFDGKWVFGCG